MSMAMKMSDGNPGALTVVMSIYQHVENIDPMGALGGFGPILSLDTLGIYGPDVWMLYKFLTGYCIGLDTLPIEVKVDESD
jgi:hypothetical protein